MPGAPAPPSPPPIAKAGSVRSSPKTPQNQRVSFAVTVTPSPHAQTGEGTGDSPTSQGLDRSLSPSQMMRSPSTSPQRRYTTRKQSVMNWLHARSTKRRSISPPGATRQRELSWHGCKGHAKIKDGICSTCGRFMGGYQRTEMLRNSFIKTSSPRKQIRVTKSPDGRMSFRSLEIDHGQRVENLKIRLDGLKRIRAEWKARLLEQRRLVYIKEKSKGKDTEAKSTAPIHDQTEILGRVDKRLELFENERSLEAEIVEQKMIARNHRVKIGKRERPRLSARSNKCKLGSISYEKLPHAARLELADHQKALTFFRKEFNRLRSFNKDLLRLPSQRNRKYLETARATRWSKLRDGVRRLLRSEKQISPDEVQVVKDAQVLLEDIETHGWLWLTQEHSDVRVKRKSSKFRRSSSVNSQRTSSASPRGRINSPRQYLAATPRKAQSASPSGKPSVFRRMDTKNLLLPSFGMSKSLSDTDTQKPAPTTPGKSPKRKGTPSKGTTTPKSSSKICSILSPPDPSLDTSLEYENEKDLGEAVTLSLQKDLIALDREIQEVEEILEEHSRVQDAIKAKREEREKNNNKIEEIRQMLAEEERNLKTSIKQQRKTIESYRKKIEEEHVKNSLLVAKLTEKRLQREETRIGKERKMPSSKTQRDMAKAQKDIEEFKQLLERAKTGQMTEEEKIRLWSKLEPQPQESN